MSASVVITCYKEKELLLRAYESLINQTDKAFEIIIINDNSPCDVTNDYCRQLEKRGAKVVWKKKNEGLSAARNDGFRFAKNEIVIPLDADDTLPQSAVAIIKRTFVSNPQSWFIYGNYEKQIDGVPKGIVSLSLITKENQLDFYSLIHNWILHGSSPCKKILWEKVGGYSSEFANTLQDMDFWISVFENGYNGSYVDAVIYNWNVTTHGMSANVTLFDQHLVMYRHADFYFEAGKYSMQHIAKNCFNSFYKAKDRKLIKEIFYKMFTSLGAKRIVFSLPYLLSIK